jgi:tripartite-type tricarboxylate transporter receptor subunit TctC
VITRINTELEQIMKLPDVQERYAVLGLVTLHTPPERVTDWIKQESPRMGQVLKAAGVEPE